MEVCETYYSNKFTNLRTIDAVDISENIVTAVIIILTFMGFTYLVFP